jgi:hypothetical protein
MSIGCPHCGKTTDLYAEPPMPAAAPTVQAPPPPPQAPRLQVAGFQSAVSSQSRLQVATPPPPPPPEEPAYEAEYAQASNAVRGPVNWIGWSLATASVLLFLVGGGMYLSNAKQGKSVFGDRQSARSALKSTATKAADDEEEETDDAATPPKSGKTATRPKSIQDLKPSPITLQKGQGSLIYAVGTLRNDSDQQRLGVRIELDLLDASGKQILVNGKPAKAQDYVQAIEPHKDWRYRALVVAPRTATVRVAKITEEE